MKVNFNRIIIPSSKDNILNLMTKFIQCKICINILNDPYDCLCCNQTFCKSCITNYIKTNNKCPFSEFFESKKDKKNENINDLLNKLKPSSSNFNKVIQSLKFYCQNKDKGCDDELSIEEISEHEKICKFNSKYKSMNSTAKKEKKDEDIKSKKRDNSNNKNNNSNNKVFIEYFFKLTTEQKKIISSNIYEKFICNKKKSSQRGLIKMFSIYKKKKKTVDLEHYKTIVLMKNFEEIRNKRLQKERKEREEQKRKNDSSQWHNIISKDQLFGYQFRRNPFQGKSILSKFDFKKHKMAIENANRNIEKNNMNNTLKAVTLHYSNIKSKLNINDEDELTLLKEKIEKEKQKNMKKRTEMN